MDGSFLAQLDIRKTKKSQFLKILDNLRIIIYQSTFLIFNKIINVKESGIITMSKNFIRRHLN